MHTMRRLLAVILALAVLMAVPQWVGAQESGGQTTHTVQAGETLYRIAVQYGTTVTALAQANNITNPNLIYVGQVLVIPGVAPAPTVTPTPVATAIVPVSVTPTVGPTPTVMPATPTVTPTTVPPAPVPGEIVYVVQPGENLFRIALKYNLPAAVVAAYNGIPNPNLIYVGQKIRIPGGAVAVTATPVPQATAPAGTPVPMTPPPSTATTVSFAYGVQVHLPNQDMNQVMTSAVGLGVTWVEQEIDWALYEPTIGGINWEPLDAMVNALDVPGIKILLTVTAAPDWARDSAEEKGPPSDYQTYANFVGQLAERYKGRVDAYAIWDEPNLRREWNTPKGISAASYIELLRLAYAAIKTADPAAVVVTAGLAPTGYNDGVNAIDDRIYLRQMYTAGVADWSDAIGAHPFGWANPPDSICCRNDQPAVSGWDDHPSFFFKQTLQDYRDIMVQNGDSGTYIWATEFGWGSNDGLNVQPPPDYTFVTYTSMDEQAQYTVRGFQIGRELGYVGPMFVWNLNFCVAAGVTSEQCLWGMLDPAGNPRPVYLAVKDMAK